MHNIEAVSPMAAVEDFQVKVSSPVEIKPDFSSGSTNPTEPPNGKRKLFEEVVEFKAESPMEGVLPRKLFVGPELCEDPVTPSQNDANKSPNIRARCLMSDRMFDGKFMCTLPLPAIAAEKSTPSSDNNTNPFKEISVMSRLPSEMDLENCVARGDSSAISPFDFSRSPLIMMRNASRNSLVGPEDFSKLSEEMGMVRADSGYSVAVTEQESRFEKEFEVVSEIGKGHFGVVKRCRNRLDGLEYAVKITKHKWRGERGKLEALQEVFALSALSVCDDNPYVVKYFNGWIEDSKLYIVVPLF